MRFGFAPLRRSAAPVVALALTALALLLPATPAQAAPPTFVSVSAIAAAANGAADPAVTLPAHQENDVILLSTIVRNSSTVATPAGWTSLGSALRGTVRYQFFWIRAGASAVPNPAIDRTGTTGDVYAAAAIYRGAIPTGDPWEVKGTIQTSTADPVALTGITTLTAQSLLVVAVSGENDNNAAITLTAANAPTALTEHYLESGTGGNAVITFSEVARTTAGATGAISANWGTGNPVGSGSLVLALKPKAAFEQATYRFFNNADSTNVGTALAAEDSAATLAASGAAFRLRILLHASLSNHAINAQAFKLQFAARSGTCDTAFTGEAYADVTTSTAIAYNDNPAPADDANLTANANDPTHGADAVVNQTYNELNNFNNPAAVNAGQDGKWDFSLIDNTAQGLTAYCFRIVTDTGALLDTYSVIPEITTARGQVFYLHDATTPNFGTLPGVASLSTTTPDTTATNASTNRDMNQTIGVAAVNPTIVVGGTALQEMWFRRFVSRPLAAQTLPTGIWAVQAAASESNNAANMNVWGVVLKVWRPSDGSTVATLLDSPTLGTVEPGTALTNVRTQTGSIAGVAVNDGDVLILELWVEKNNATSRTYTINYDGTTEGATGAGASNAAFLEAPRAIAFYRTVAQSGYRFLANADNTTAGAALAGQNTAASLGLGVFPFRLRMLLHVADINLPISGETYKLQFAAKGAGSCAAPTGAYTDVTGTSLIAFHNNPTPADGAAVVNNGSDPAHSGHTLVNQTYEEANDFTNTAAINAGQDGKWDFALTTNGVPPSTVYCFRVVTSAGVALDYYSFYPEVTTPAVPTPVSFNAFETATAALAVTGPIRTKVAGTAFSLDVVAISGGVQQAGFTDKVTVQLLGNNTLGVVLDGQGCPTTFTVLQTVTVDPTITGGRSTVNFAAVAESWRDVRVKVSWPTQNPTVARCSTDNFAIRPSSLASFAVTDTDWQTTGSPGARALNLVTFAATPLHKAGRPFSVRATAVNSAAVTTSNYEGAPTKVLSACAGAACTSSFGTLTLTTTFAAGQLASDAASYNEVGAFALQLQDTDFASVDAGDTTGDCSLTPGPLTGRFICSAPLNVGRFVPDHLAVSLSTPTFAVTSWSCGFTYIGQKFGYTVQPVITVTGQDSSDNPTNLYTGAWFRVSNASLTGKAYAAASGTLDTSGVPGTDPVIDSALRTLTFSSGTGFSFTRPATTSGPFDAEIGLAINVIDADSVIYSVTTPSPMTNPVRFGQAVAPNGISFPAGKAMRYGRLHLAGATGSGLADLPVRITAQYWNGSAFVTNTDDSCTVLSTEANVTLSPYTGGVSSTNLASPGHISFAGGAIKSGLGFVKILKPSPAATSRGTATVTIDLGAESKAYLQGNWNGSPTYTVNPSARAAFGVFGAQPRNFIFNRENH